MQITGKQVWDILVQHGWSPNPEGYINPFLVEQEGDTTQQLFATGTNQTKCRTILSASS